MPWRRPVPVAPSVRPSVVMTSTGSTLRTSRATTDAGASTAASNDASSCAPGRVSSSTIARRLPLRFVLAHDELAGARGGPPVDPAQVVADLVLAQGQELLAVDRRRVEPHRERRRAAQPARRARRRPELVDPRADRDLVGPPDHPAAAREPERIGDRER